MTESEWLSSTDPDAMLQGLLAHSNPSRRQLRLFACACCRQVWNLLIDERSRHAVETAERYADGQATDQELAAARAAAWAVWTTAGDARDAAAGAAWAARATAGDATWAARAAAGGAAWRAQCALLRYIVGNPFRPVSLDPAWRAWRDGVIPRLAQAAYDERLENLSEHQMYERFITKIGTTSSRCLICGYIVSDGARGGPRHRKFCSGNGLLDPQRLAVLADALEEAGCQQEDILQHLRGPGPHARGCFVLDLILRKEVSDERAGVVGQ